MKSEVDLLSKENSALKEDLKKALNQLEFLSQPSGQDVNKTIRGKLSPSKVW